MKITKHIKLSVTNLCQWLGVSLINFDAIISWQDYHKIQLRFHLFDPVRERSWKQRLAYGPGTYTPTWTPELSLDVGIRQYPFDFCWLMSYKEPVKCNNPKCGYRTQRKDKLKRHRDCCRDETIIVSKKARYGDETIVPDTDNPTFYFATFDIETIERPAVNAEVNNCK